MQITDVLAQMGGLDSLSRELGISQSQAATGASALLPAILGGFRAPVGAARVLYEYATGQPGTATQAYDVATEQKRADVVTAAAGGGSSPR